MRTLVLSDIHLGLPEAFPGRLKRTPATLAPLLLVADRIILNGDTADTHDPRWRERGLAELGELGELAKAKGVELIRISGNHDVDWEALTHAELAEGAVLVTHGHAFSKSILPWVPASGEMNRVFAEALRNNPETAAGAVAAANHAALIQWSDERSLSEPTALVAIGTRPSRILSVLRWWRQYPFDAAEFAARYAPNAKFVVCGHSHRAGAWSVGTTASSEKRWIINTGSFGFPSRPHGVLIEETSAGATLELRQILARGGRYELAGPTRASSWRIH